MKALFSIVVLGVVAFGGGCMRVNTIPAWKGIPAQIVSPTSLEAMAWHDGVAARRAARRQAMVASHSRTCCPLPADVYLEPR